AGNGLSVDLTTDAATHTQKITYRLSDTPVFGEKAVPGEAGKPGKDGKDGKVEVIGKDGSAVVINGKDGSIGLNGTNGQNGLSIRGEKGDEGKPGVDGTTTIKRIVITDPNGQNPHSVATLDDGLKFAGNVGNFYSKLNETVEIVGGVTVGETEKAEDKLTDENIGVVATKEKDKNGKLDIKLAKNLKNLESATFTKTEKGVTTTSVINDKGLTIGSGDSAVALTKDGLNMGNHEITNVKESTTATNAATVGQVEKAKTELTTAINNKADYALVKADGQDGAYKVTNGKITLKVKNKTKPDEAAKEVVIEDVASKSSLDTLKEEMKKNIQVGGKGADGADGVDGTIGVNGKDGKPG
ncbi:hypothetical protein HMPREF1039_1631, partial [Megasphaera lornae]